MADSVHYSKVDTKTELKIASGDTSDDTILDRWGLSGDRIIDNMIFPYRDTLPLTGSDLTEDMAAASIAWVAHKYKKHNKAFEAAKTYKDEFDVTMKGVVTRLIASAESRTLRTAVMRPYSTEPLSLE